VGTAAQRLADVLGQGADVGAFAATHVDHHLHILPADDVDGVKAVVAELLSVYNTLPSYRTMMDHEGVAGPADLTIAGSEAEVRDRVAHLKSIGVTDFNAVIVGRNADERGRTNAVLAEFL
jgi:hypothetical protein